MCDSTADDLKTRTDAAMSLKASIDQKVGAAKGLSAFGQGSGEALQKSFGAVGDSGAAGHAQAMKVFAGKLEHKAEDGEKIAKALGELQEQGNALSDFTNPETVTKAERTMESVDKKVAEGEAVADEWTTSLLWLAPRRLKPMQPNSITLSCISSTRSSRTCLRHAQVIWSESLSREVRMIALRCAMPTSMTAWATSTTRWGRIVDASSSQS
jgi:hypothetical protein